MLFQPTFLILYGKTGFFYSNVCAPVPSYNFWKDFFSVALQSLKDFGRLTYRGLLELFRHTVGLLGRVISPSQGLYLHRTTQHRKTQASMSWAGFEPTIPATNRPRPKLQTARPLWPALKRLHRLISIRLSMGTMPLECTSSFYFLITYNQ
jgi:hypothetical protein